MKIKEIAEKLKISPRAIRFYEQKGLIAPGKQMHNQYRTFSEREIWRLQTIIALREVGMPIEEIKTVLAQIEQGEQDELRYYLELQRSVMVSQWVEMKQIIETIDRMIDLLQRNRSLVLDDLYRLAEGSRRLRELRKNWRDRWNFDRQADSYDERVRNRPYDYEQALDLTVEWIAPKPGESGLDIGTGTGNLAGRFLAKGIRMAGIDQSKEMLKQCRRKHPGMETRLGNFLAIPYLDGQFDFAVTSFALHHLTDEQKLLALEEMRRVLKPHGRICITDLMFENERKRAEYLEMLRQQGNVEAIRAIEDEYYADRSRLLDWYERHGYRTRHKQISELLHIVCAVPVQA
ncbi:MerR family transcriptional regulator [Effusibacillus pohliae]|uniref:MerR family transcriptional regulator n=1 Tax=Effusibacillus pohliae TaxID=232270 RepID=UPI000478212E|nr:methyltransferase domain-containing protein [Effusibacillus pohliae]